MDDHRLKQLQDRAKRATELGEEIQQLRAATTQHDYQNIGFSLRTDIFLAGRDAVLAKKEGQLNELVGGELTKETAAE